MSYCERIVRPGGVVAFVRHSGKRPTILVCDVCDGRPTIPTPWSPKPGDKVRQIDLCHACITRRSSDPAFVAWSDVQIRRNLGLVPLTRAAAVSADPAANTVGQSHGLAAQDTERAAALAVAPKTGGQRARVLAAICTSLLGLTDAETSDQTGIFLTSVLPRRGELVQGGWVEDSGRRRPTGHGGDGIVWQATLKALSYADREGWLK